MTDGMEASGTGAAEGDGHLVLTRKEGEAIDIGDQIRVRFVRVRGGQVKVVVDAPRSVNVRRSELAQQD